MNTQRLAVFIENLKQMAQGAHQKVARSPLSIPWFAAVCLAMAHKDHMNLPEYSLKWIAKKVHLSEKDTQLAVDVMVENEMIEWNGKHYRPTQARTMILNHQRTRRDYIKNLEFWLERSQVLLANQSADSNESSSFFRVFRASEKNVEQIEVWVKELEERIHNLLMSTADEKNEIRCFIWSHFNVASQYFKD